MLPARYVRGLLAHSSHILHILDYSSINYSESPHDPVLISLAQDGEGFLLWIEVVEIQGCDLGGPGA
jgi:hypothetical protein